MFNHGVHLNYNEPPTRLILQTLQRGQRCIFNFYVNNIAFVGGDGDGVLGREQMGWIAHIPIGFLHSDYRCPMAHFIGQPN